MPYSALLECYCDRSRFLTPTGIATKIHAGAGLPGRYASTSQQEGKSQVPKDAREQHIQGTVLLKAVISREGDVAEVSVVSGDSLLAPAAVGAVKHWKYRPYVLNGEPLEVETEITVNFVLSS